MADNDLFPTELNHSSFDNEGLEILPLITKERTQKFELLLHLIPNLKQHLIVCGVSGIGKTLLLDMLYDINSDAWQCCFVQGSDDLSFEKIEAQLAKTMLRNNYESLDSAFHDFQEQYKKIVLIIDDAGLLVSGLMTALVDYATGQPALKLIFSLTPQDRQTHRTTDKALDSCYLLEIPALTKRQCAFFLRHLAAKPRTYSALQAMNDKLLDKIYRETQGIPANLISHFTKLARENQNDHTKWIMVFAGLIILAIAINQGILHLKSEPVESESELQSTVQIEPIEKQTEKISATITAQKIKNDSDIVPEFKLDIEKTLSSAPVNTTVVTQSEMAIPIEKTLENSNTEAIKSESKINDEKLPIPEIIAVNPEVVTPKINLPNLPVAPIFPEISFPKVEPAKGIKIHPLPDTAIITSVPLVAESPIQKTTPDVKIESQKIEFKPIETMVMDKKKSNVGKLIKKTDSVKKTLERNKKHEAKKVKSIKIINNNVKAELKPETKHEVKTEKTAPSVTKDYTLQLITLSSGAAVTNFQKKHPELSKNFRVVKLGTEGKERFSLMYGGFANDKEATKAKQVLPAEFSNALLRKNLNIKP